MEAAAGLKKTMDLSVDPCEDFYKYSCGGFIKKAKIQEDRSEISPSMEISDTIRDQVGKRNHDTCYKFIKNCVHNYIITENTKPLKSLIDSFIQSLMLFLQIFTTS